jgi:hypothetical protein
VRPPFVAVAVWPISTRQFASDRGAHVQVVEVLARQCDAGLELGAGSPQLLKLLFLQARVGRLALERDRTAVPVVGQLVL